MAPRLTPAPDPLPCGHYLANMISPYWTPSSAAINHLPEPVRRFVMELETIADPAGEVRARIFAEAELSATRMLLAETRRSLGPRTMTVVTYDAKLASGREAAAVILAADRCADLPGASWTPFPDGNLAPEIRALREAVHAHRAARAKEIEAAGS